MKGSAEGVMVTFDLSNPFIVAGLLIGEVPYLFGSMGMQQLVDWRCCCNRVRRQFKKFLEL